jgi:hypothetical protein
LKTLSGGLAAAETRANHPASPATERHGAAATKTMINIFFFLFKTPLSKFPSAIDDAL